MDEQTLTELCLPYVKYLPSNHTPETFLKFLIEMRPHKKLMNYLTKLGSRVTPENTDPVQAPEIQLPIPAPEIQTNPLPIPAPKIHTEITQEKIKVIQRTRFLFSYNLNVQGAKRIDPEILGREFAITGIKSFVDIETTESTFIRLVCLATIKRTTLNRVETDMMTLFGIKAEHNITDKDSKALAAASNAPEEIKNDQDRIAAENMAEQGSVLARMAKLEKLLAESQKRIATLEGLCGMDVVEKKKKKRRKQKKDTDDENE